MKKIRIISLFVFLFLSFSFQLSAQDTKKDVQSMTTEDIANLTYSELLDMPFEDLLYLAQKLGISVDDLLNMKISVSSKESSTLREQPGIVSVITGDELIKTGARDLVDILQFLPGFFVGYDVGGVIGIGLRGNWTQEGKILLQIDGMDFNDLMYASTQLGNHFPVEQIKRIEIIRGPGSSIYGGCAELGVINIITKTGEDLNGGYASVSFGKFKETYARKNINVAFGKKINDFEFSILAYAGEAMKSNKIYDNVHYTNPDTLSNGDGYCSAKNVNINLKYKGLSIRYLHDFYNTVAVENYTYKNSFPSHIAEVTYEGKISDKLSIIPKYTIKYNEPWHTEGYDGNISALRYNCSLMVKYNPIEQLNLIFGTEAVQDIYKYKKQDTSVVKFYNGKSRIEFSSIAIFGQAIAKTKIFNITLGGRYEHHSLYGDAFAPRIGLNKIFGRFHFKLLYSKAFRSPSLGNFMYNQEIVPEKSEVTELEAGVKVSSKIFLTANIYQTHLTKPIVYFENNDDWWYENTGNTGVKGFEISSFYKSTKLSINLSYSYYTVKGQEKIPNYLVPNDNDAVLGAPQYKFALNSIYNITKKISVSPAFIFFSERYGYTQNVNDEAIVGKIPSKTLVDCYFNYENFVAKGLNLSFGIFNIFDTNSPYIQPYSGTSSPYPGPGREFYFRLIYNFKLSE